MEQQIIKCVFCKGEGENPYFKGTCPVCKGKGKNQVTGKYMACGDCHSSGQKRGTTLTCYTCAGLGVIPDTRETFRRAREEIKETQEEMARERPGRFSKRKDEKDRWEEESFDSAQDKKAEPARRSLGEGGEENIVKTHFCQCCGGGVNESIQIKICPDCFGKMKEIV